MAAPTAARQHQTVAEPPPRLSHLEGAIVLIRDADREAAVVNAPVLDGDRLDVAEGHLLLQWPDGSLLAAGDQTVVDLAPNRTVRLERGRVVVVTPSSMDTRPFVVMTANAVVTIVEPGEYCIQTGADQAHDVVTVLVVGAGNAWLAAEGAQVPVGSAQQAAVRGTAAPAFESNGDTFDGALETWARAAAHDLAVTSVAAGYLPDDLRIYGATLDRHGDWDHDADAGYVWYPEVAASWRPYSTGVWLQAGHYGWTWAGSEAWAWPTHHYGGWAIGKRGRWYWRPDRIWAPARVRWAIGPGYVAWCPLDWRGQPSLASPFAAPDRRDRPHGPGADPWRGWTTLASDRFRARAPVQRAAINPGSLPPADLAAFVTQPAPPTRTRGGFAVERRSPAARGNAMPAHASPAPAPYWTSARPGELTRPGIAPAPGTRPNPSDHPVYAPIWPSYGAVGGLDRNRRAPEPIPYERATPFLNPRWTSRPGMPFTAGLPQVPERDAAPSPAPQAVSPDRAARPREGEGHRAEPPAGRSGGTQRIPPPSSRGPRRP